MLVAPVRCEPLGNCISVHRPRVMISDKYVSKPERNRFCAMYCLEHLAVIRIIHLECSSKFLVNMGTNRRHVPQCFQMPLQRGSEKLVP